MAQDKFDLTRAASNNEFASAASPAPLRQQAEELLTTLPRERCSIERRKYNAPVDATAAFARARQLLMEKANAQFKAQDYASAIESYRSALQLGTPEPLIALSIHQQFGAALEEQGSYAAARAEYQLAIDSAPDLANTSHAQAMDWIKPLAYLSLARTYIAQKQFERARETLDALSKRPNVLPIYDSQIEKLRQMLPPAP